LMQSLKFICVVYYCELINWPRYISSKSDDSDMGRFLQVRRVQKYVETLDALKVRNATQNSSSQQPMVVTTKWETFET